MAHGCGCSGSTVVTTSRRAAIVAAGLSVLGAGQMAKWTATGAAQPQSPASDLPENALITLGVQAGPIPVANRIGISSALKLGRDVYVIDCGLGSLNAYANAGLRFSDLKSMFITHLHTDHIVDYFSFFVSGGSTSPADRPRVQVYGPGSAGGLPPSQVGDPHPPTVEPSAPVPGLAATTAALRSAFAYATNIFIRDNGISDVYDLIDVVEIGLPPGSDYLNTAPRMDPFLVMSDENVVVTAVLTTHCHVYPAFAFRFDFRKPAFSITFSGDTTKSDNVIALAQDTDILVHEAVYTLDDAYYGGIFPAGYLASSHTSAEQVGEVAAAARVGQVILSHYLPAGLPDSAWLAEIRKKFSGPTTIARDGQVFQF